MSSHSFAEDQDGKLSAASSFDVPSCLLDLSTTSVDFGSSLPLSRSISSSSSWTELNNKGDSSENEAKPSNRQETVETTLIGGEKNNAEENSQKPEEEDNDSVLGTEEEEEELNRKMVKAAIVGLVVILVLGKAFALLFGKGGATDKETIEKLMTNLDRKITEQWELEKELAMAKEKWEAERSRRDEVEQELRKAYERLEVDLRVRLNLQGELESTRAALAETEAELWKAEQMADERWMGGRGGGGGLAELGNLYRRAKQAEWLRGELKETSEWWVPLYWRVVRVTFFTERASSRKIPETSDDGYF